MERNLEEVKLRAKNFADEHGLDAGAVECAMIGVIERVQNAENKGAIIDEKLIQAAYVHYFESQKAYFNKLMHNIDGEFDRLSEKVYCDLRYRLHMEKLDGLFNGTVTPESVVGTGHKCPKAVASQYLRKMIHNEKNPSVMVDEIIVTRSGRAYKSERMAMNSNSYQRMLSGTYSDKRIADFGVMPDEYGDGYVIYVCFAKFNSD